MWQRTALNAQLPPAQHCADMVARASWKLQQSAPLPRGFNYIDAGGCGSASVDVGSTCHGDAPQSDSEHDAPQSVVPCRAVAGCGKPPPGLRQSARVSLMMALIMSFAASYVLVTCGFGVVAIISSRLAPNSPGVALTAPDRTRANAVLSSSLGVDIIKRISRDALGSKDVTFHGNEKDRNVLWTPIVKSMQTAFEQKEPANNVLLYLADATKKVNAIYNGILFSTLTSLTSPKSTARRWVEASGRASPRDGMRALLEVTKRLIPRVVRPLGHYEELCSIFFDSTRDPDPLIQDFNACLTAISSGASGVLDDMVAKKQLLASLDLDF
ncbi:hypothetical protein CYMTET_34594 [Cymbomonas tetramitiformis]|uniref:Uncharacterized protein n=1 Tax=Cymbomonas tetramitiformis TaxID=36881 RepID=A0AAE0KPQ2_9CHLO|nr:hypothetical protein CYMTET_34594 [Cymbomonas tetramitiformis]